MSRRHSVAPPEGWGIYALVVVACAAGCATSRPADGRRRTRRAAKQGLEQIVAGSDHTCVRFSGGRVRCWGDNARGQLGDGTRRNRYWPRDVVGLDDARSLSATSRTTCAVHRSGAVSCWGDPLESYDPKTYPGVPVLAPQRVAGIDDAVDVSVGGNHACALRKGGTVSCWGAGGQGQLGNGSKSDSAGGVEVTLQDVRQVSAGASTTCAVKHDGSTWCWGRDDYGLLGRKVDRASGSDGDTGSLVPILAERVPKLASVAVHDFNSCGIEDDDARHVHCWGSLYGCAVGFDVPYGDRDLAIEVPGVRNVRAILGDQCVLDDNGVTCWREAQRDAYVDDTVQCEGKRIELENAKSAALGRGYGCAITSTTEVQCWGVGGNGQLGRGSLDDSEGPVATADLFAPDRPDVDPYLQLRAEVPKTKVEGTAVVWSSAKLYSRPERGADIGRLSDASAEDRYQRDDDQFVVSIVADHGEFVEVRNVGWSEARPRCGAHFAPSVSDHELRFFVERSELVPVLPAEYADSHDDGSTILIAAGTPIIAKPVGLGIYVGSIWVPMYVGGDDLALSYQPAEVSGEPGDRTLGRRGETVHLNFLGKSRTLDDFPGYLMRNGAIEEDGEHTRVVMREDCVRIEAVVDHVVPPPDSRGAGMGGGSGMISSGRRPKRDPQWTVAAEVTTYFRDGTRAGTRRESLTTKAAPTTAAGRPCWKSGADLLLCHDPADVSHDPGDP